MKILFISAIMSLLFLQPVWADEASDLKELTRDKINIVISLLRDTKIDKKTRNKKIIETVNPIFDFKKMAKLSLGKKHWVALSADQKKEFSDLFSKRLQESYLDKLDLYTDEEVVVDEAKRVKKRIHVVTHLVSKVDKKEMVYKFSKSKKGWKVYDVVILGVSVVQTYRSQFNGFLKKDSMDNLLAKLKATGDFTISTDKPKKQE